MLPYLSLHDIDKCVDYLYDAIKVNKKMCVVADYDVDGATSCSIMVSGLRTLGANIVYFVPIGLNMVMVYKQVLLMICL